VASKWTSTKLAQRVGRLLGESLRAAKLFELTVETVAGSDCLPTWERTLCKLYTSNLKGRYFSNKKKGGRIALPRNDLLS
jgi:hypothetical protein